VEKQAETVVAGCAVCDSPARRQIDLLLFEGFKPEKVCETLPEAPPAAAVQAHLMDLHLYYDEPMIVACLVRWNQEAREIFESTKNGENGYQGRLLRATCLRIRFSTLAKLQEYELARRKGAGKDARTFVTEALNTIAERDPDLVDRIQMERLQRRGFKIQAPAVAIDEG